MAADEDVLASFLDLLTPENRAWLQSLPESEQRDVAVRHLEAVQGDKEHGLGRYDTHDTQVEGVAVGDLQAPGHLANAMVRQEQERRS
ncbi:hypothetical protein OEIGOIKO_06343 [Streptomyces chrestomyceticus JCM 4735]|uniref:Uncharacterized protein n=1 Tax=Streptomyces chrestomyceticus JCM 4735 TaxID=1306181 RepID=A0A7U9PZJ5_9ACTN|nr:hypothetical protein [Streptomyces chrestomyceticus]GCD38527.1 hypothetical protein OEIGOIKO_06343 [Streptomyces chrestomyceticus JCM 4735]